MSNYSLLLQKLDEEPSLQYLKAEYPLMIGTLAEMNLSLKQMISLIWAAEKDCLKFTTEIERLNTIIRQLQLVHSNQPEQGNSSIDELEEIIYDIEAKLSTFVEQIQKSGLQDFEIKSKHLSYRDSLEIIDKFINSKCMNKSVQSILNQQLEEEVNKQKRKNLQLQIENMKMISNLKPHELNKHQFFSRDRIKHILNSQLKILRGFKGELAQIQQYIKRQYQILFQQDKLIDHLKISNQFQRIYETILNNIKSVNYHQVSAHVKIGLAASKGLNSKEIDITCDKIAKKFEIQMAKLEKLVFQAAFENPIIFSTYGQNEQLLQHSQQLTTSVKSALEKCLRLHNMLHQIFAERAFLEKQTRSQFEMTIFQLNDINKKLRMTMLLKAVEKPLRKQSSQSWDSLKSIQYNQ